VPTLAERLGVPAERVESIDLLRTPRLPDPEKLLEAAFAAGAQTPDDAAVLLGAAALSLSQSIPDGRHAVTLALLAPLLAQSDPYMTLGPTGAEIRAEVMPNGWRYTLTSWPRLRYAWREGMQRLLRVDAEDQRVVEALHEATRMNPAEPEPVSVAIQEQWPAPAVSFAVAGTSLLLTGWQILRANRSRR